MDDDAFLASMRADALIADKAFDADERVSDPCLRRAGAVIVLAGIHAVSILIWLS